MGILSRKLFRACESMCVCCPSLSSSSRKPVKRYRKLLADIFPKTPESVASDRKIVKLCEYAARNPIRIPKIAKYLEERCLKELRSGQIKYINVATDIYVKMLSLCNKQMVYFAFSLLKVVSELIERAKDDRVLKLGCDTLTKFIYSQSDGTYAHNIEKFVHKICKLGREEDDETNGIFRASALQCMSAMIWFMAQYSYMFHAIDEIVYAILDNYEPHDNSGENNGSRELHRNWVDEIVRSESRAGCNDFSSSSAVIRQRPERKDPMLLTPEETATPKVWGQICLQRLVDLAKESTTMRRILDPMLGYFDIGRHWISRECLALVLLSDMAFFVEKSGQQQLILAAVIRHLDHKNVFHDPNLKSHVIQVGTSLAKQIRLRGVLTDTGLVNDLCRHLRRSLQVTYESVGSQVPDLNCSLQSSIEDCLIEIVKGIGDSQPLLDMIAITLEKLPSSGVAARATLGSLIILAHMISLSPLSSRRKQIFPEALLVQLLKAMLHADVDVRVGAHQMFSVLLEPCSCLPKHNVGYLRTRRWGSANSSVFASISTILEKVRLDKENAHKRDSHNQIKDYTDDDWKQGCTPKAFPMFPNLSSIIDKTAGSADQEPCAMVLSEDQITLLLSAFWVQANLADNMPGNYEAISHSFALTLICSKWKSASDHIMVQFFQLPLSLRSASLDPSNGILPPSCQRSVFVLSMSMLMVAAKLYKIQELIDLLRPTIPTDADRFLTINEEFQVSVKLNFDVREYGSAMDNQLAQSLMSELRSKIFEHDLEEMDILVHKLSSCIEVEVEDLARQLSDPFTPDDVHLFGPRTLLDVEQGNSASHTVETLSLEEDGPSGPLFEDEVTSEVSAIDMARFVPKIPASPSVSHVISIGELLESALEVAGRVAGTSVSTSPLPYDTLTRQCEALGTGTRKVLSTWLANDNKVVGASGKNISEILSARMASSKISSITLSDISTKPADPCLPLRLPPASPYDNFLKAAGC